MLNNFGPKLEPWGTTVINSLTHSSYWKKSLFGCSEICYIMRKSWSEKPYNLSFANSKLWLIRSKVLDRFINITHTFSTLSNCFLFLFFSSSIFDTLQKQTWRIVTFYIESFRTLLVNEAVYQFSLFRLVCLLYITVILASLRSSRKTHFSRQQLIRRVNRDKQAWVLFLRILDGISPFLVALLEGKFKISFFFGWHFQTLDYI